MANKTRSSFEKRQKELARQARRKAKQDRRHGSKSKAVDGEAEPEAASPIDDPDLVGLVLGPQPSDDDPENGNEDEESRD